MVDVNETAEQEQPESPIEAPIEEAPQEAPTETAKGALGSDNVRTETIEEETQPDIKNEVVEESNNEDKPKKRQTQKDKIQCKKCFKEMTIKSYKYSHEKNCQGQIADRPVKPQAKPKPKAKHKPPPTNEEVEEHEVSCSSREPTNQVIQNPLPPTRQQPMRQPLQPINSLTQHYQLLQNEYIKQKQEKYNNLCKNIFATKPKKR